MIPRKLVETACRRAWLALLPVAAVPALVLLLVSHPVAYESTGTAWVSRADTDVQARSLDPLNTPSKQQSLVLSDLLATEAFREAVAVDSALVPPTAPRADLEAAAAFVARHIAPVIVGPNLIAIRASAPKALQAQALASGMLRQYQLRSRQDATRELQSVVDYFQKQVAVSQDELMKTRTEMATYLKAHPGVDKTGVDAEYTRLATRGEAQSRTVEKLSQSLQDAELQFAAGGASAAPSLSFVVQDVPNLPAAPIAIPASKRLGYPAAGAFLGLLIGVTAVYISYRADHTIRSRDDLAGLGVPVLGYVPLISPREARLLRGYTPLRWVAPLRRDYARRVAASISPLPDEKRIAS